jgi:hypothetical protein
VKRAIVATALAAGIAPGGGCNTNAPAPAAPVKQAAPELSCTTVADSDDYHLSVRTNTLGGRISYTASEFGSDGSWLRVIDKAEYDRWIARTTQHRDHEACVDQARKAAAIKACK